MKTQGVLYPEVHCNYQSLGESLRPGGKVDNFLITCFCRFLFKEKHPSSSGRHYFFPLIGEAILVFQDFPNEVLIRTTFEGAAKASKNRNLGHSDNRPFFQLSPVGIGLFLLLILSIRFLPSSTHCTTSNQISIGRRRMFCLDCGVFSMKFMETWKPFVDMRKVFSLNDILNIRIQYANKIYFMSQNETDLTLVTDYYSKC